MSDFPPPTRPTAPQLVYERLWRALSCHVEVDRKYPSLAKIQSNTQCLTSRIINLGVVKQNKLYQKVC